MKVTSVIINETTKVIEVTAYPAVVGVPGKDAFEVWKEKEGKPDGTYEEYIEAITPKIDFKINEAGHLIYIRKGEEG